LAQVRFWIFLMGDIEIMRRTERKLAHTIDGSWREERRQETAESATAEVAD
jgi:hypothetical protein